MSTSLQMDLNITCTIEHIHVQIMYACKFVYIGLFCRIWFLLQGSFAKENITYTNEHIHMQIMYACEFVYTCLYKYIYICLNHYKWILLLLHTYKYETCTTTMFTWSVYIYADFLIYEVYQCMMKSQVRFSVHIYVWYM